MMDESHENYDAAQHAWEDFTESAGIDPNADPELHALFEVGYFDMDGIQPWELQAIREEIREHVADWYDLEFEEYFDWEAWRDWYETA